MLVLGLRLHQRGFSAAQLRLGVGYLAGHSPTGLAFGIAGSLQLEALTVCGRLGSLVCRREVITLNGGDQLPGLHIVPFVYREGLNSARDARADDYFVGIHGTDQLQIGRAVGGKKIPTEGDDEQDTEDDEDAIPCIHTSFLQTRGRLALGMGISARTRLTSLAP